MSFTVYVAGNGMAASVRGRLHELCAERDVAGEVNVVDVAADPQAAEELNIVGIPTVVREHPRPRRRVIGSLEDGRRVAEALGLDDRYDGDGGGQ
jgi:KaiB-like protein